MFHCFEHNTAADAAKGFFLKIEFSKLAKNMKHYLSFNDRLNALVTRYFSLIVLV